MGAVVGFGELGAALARQLADRGLRVRGYGHPRPDPAHATRLRERIAAAGAEPCADLAEATAGAEIVLVCVPGAAAAGVARAAAPALAPGALWVDLSSADPDDKAGAAVGIEAAGARYVDAAVLGAVAASGAAVPILASGSGAGALGELAGPLGLTVRAIDAPAGDAARVKLLRSVYMKGRDALIAEMLLAARRHGVEDAVTQSIAGPGEEVPFPALADRVLRSLALHAERRADELEASGALLRRAAIAPEATGGAERRLRRIAAHDLRERFAGRPPASGAEVLDALAEGDGAD